MEKQTYTKYYYKNEDVVKKILWSIDVEYDVYDVLYYYFWLLDDLNWWYYRIEEFSLLDENKISRVIDEKKSNKNTELWKIQMLTALSELVSNIEDSGYIFVPSIYGEKLIYTTTHHRLTGKEFSFLKFEANIIEWAKKHQIIS